MSYLGEALSFLTGLLTSPFATPSTFQDTTSRGRTRPTEESTSYFPERPGSSGRSSLSSDSSQDEARLRPDIIRQQTGSNPLPPLAREFPAPTEELDIDKQLAKQPMKRSLHDSLRRAATAERRSKVEDAETKAQKLAAAKLQLLALADRR